MSAKLAGVLVLLLAGTLLLVAASVRAQEVAGSPRSITPPAPPAVGACLDQEREPVACLGPHRWEVVAEWAADDPRRQVEATTDVCERAAARYAAIERVQVIGAWTARATVVSAVLEAPTDQRAGPNRGWVVCGVQPAWIDLRTGSIGTARSVADIPDLFGLCLDFVVDTGGSSCLMPHDVQVLGTWNDPSALAALAAGAGTVQQLSPALQSAAARSCLALAATLTGATDPTYAGRLDYIVVIQAGHSDRPQLNCLATPTGGRVLIGSITALGDRPVPLR